MESSCNNCIHRPVCRVRPQVDQLSIYREEIFGKGKDYKRDFELSLYEILGGNCVNYVDSSANSPVEQT